MGDTPERKDATAKQAAPAKVGSVDRLWTPRVWTGMSFSGWLRLLARNRFAISPMRLPQMLAVTIESALGSPLWLVQKLFYGRKIARIRIEEDPIFIIGHWRSGTTLLHELLVLDERHTYPDTYACFAPNHFLLSARFITWWLKYLLPKHRPMDNVRMGWDRPQEDEFALCNMGLPSPYLTQAFPNRPPQCQEYLFLKDLPPRDLKRWKAALSWFLKCVTVKSPKRIVLKSPTHTGRVEALLDLFPKARFIHIVRNPYAIFPSTVKTWQRLYKFEGLQVPRFEGLEEYVLDTFNRVYEVFEKDRRLIDPSRFCEVRYEDIVSDPIGQVQTIYERLGLGRFDEVAGALEKYASEMAEYKTDRYELSPAVRRRITDRWGDYIRKYGYAPQSDEP